MTKNDFRNQCVARQLVGDNIHYHEAPAAPSITATMGVVTEEHMAALQGIVVQGCWSRECLIGRYRASIPPAWPLIEVNVDPADIVLDMLKDLQRVPAGTTYPLLEFVERLASAGEGQHVQERLRKWVNETAQALDLTVRELQELRDRVVARGQVAPPTNPELLIALHPTLVPRDHVRVQAWIWTDQVVVPVYAEDTPQSVRAVDSCLDRLITEATDHLNRLGVKGAPLVGFFLPLHLSCRLDVANWEIDIGFRRGVGTQFPVVVRSLERIYQQNMHITWPVWERKWADLHQADEPALGWLAASPDDTNESLFAHVSSYIAVALTDVPPKAPRAKGPDVLTVLISAGVPVALWPHGKGHSPAEVRAALDPLLKHRLRDLPQLLLEKRSEGLDIWRQVTLLWDDPRRPLTKLRLQQPWRN